MADGMLGEMGGDDTMANQSWCAAATHPNVGGSCIAGTIVRLMHSVPRSLLAVAAQPIGRDYLVRQVATSLGLTMLTGPPAACGCSRGWPQRYRTKHLGRKSLTAAPLLRLRSSGAGKAGGGGHKHGVRAGFLCAAGKRARARVLHAVAARSLPMERTDSACPARFGQLLRRALTEELNVEWASLAAAAEADARAKAGGPALCHGRIVAVHGVTDPALSHLNGRAAVAVEQVCSPGTPN